LNTCSSLKLTKTLIIAQMKPPSVIVSTNTITDPNIANSNRQFIQLAP